MQRRTKERTKGKRRRKKRWGRVSIWGRWRDERQERTDLGMCEGRGEKKRGNRIMLSR